MTDGQILDSIRLSGLPCGPILTDDEIINAIQKVQRDLRYAYPQIGYGIFTTHPQQQVYDLFSSVEDTSTSKGVFPDGIWVIELVWSPGGTNADGNLSVFGLAPFLQGATILPGAISIYSFNTPADWWIWDANWSAFVARFGSQYFEHTTNAPGSPIRLFPIPSDTQSAWIRYKKYRELTSFQTTAEDESSFLMLVESECCRVVARKLFAVAGTTVGSLKQDGKSALYWTMEADRKLKQGTEYFESRRYETSTPVQRT